jgi:tetratricopeptide (TPR) repeat protein
LKKKPVVLIVILLAVVLALQVMVIGKQKTSNAKAEKLWEHAAALQTAGKYNEALVAYERYCCEGGIDEERAAEACLVMGNLAMDNLADYELALGYYSRIKKFHSNLPEIQDVWKRLDECRRQIAKSDGEIKPNVPQEDILATVDDYPITRTLFEQTVNLLNPPERTQILSSKRAKKVHLDNLILKYLFYKRGRIRGYNRNTEYLAYTLNAKMTWLSNRVYKDEISNKIRFTKDELWNFYNKYKAQYFTIPDKFTGVLYLRVNTKEEAQAASDRIEAGERFEVVAREVSLDEESRELGGVLPDFMYGMEGMKMNRVLGISIPLSKMKDGEVSGPVKVNDGYAVLYRSGIVKGRVRSFDESMKAGLKDRYQERMEQVRKKDYFEELWKSGKIEIYEDRL